MTITRLRLSAPARRVYRVESVNNSFSFSVPVSLHQHLVGSKGIPDRHVSLGTTGRTARGTTMHGGGDLENPLKLSPPLMNSFRLLSLSLVQAEVPKCSAILFPSSSSSFLFCDFRHVYVLLFPFSLPLHPRFHCLWDVAVNHLHPFPHSRSSGPLFCEDDACGPMLATYFLKRRCPHNLLHHRFHS